METINGFVAVRLPHLNYLVQGRDVIPRLNNTYYAGMDRQRWADLFDEEYYKGKVPSEVARIGKSLNKEANDFSGLILCRELDTALRLLSYCNRQGNNNELIAVRSPSLDETRGTIKTNHSVEWLGYDFFAWGEWSLISEGLFMHPAHYATWTTRTNEFGLFDDSSWLIEYTSDYEKFVDQDLSEPIAPKESGLERIAIRVGRVSA
jgi:hypothetical protein